MRTISQLSIRKLDTFFVKTIFLHVAGNENGKIVDEWEDSGLISRCLFYGFEFKNCPLRLAVIQC